MDIARSSLSECYENRLGFGLSTPAVVEVVDFSLRNADSKYEVIGGCIAHRGNDLCRIPNSRRHRPAVLVIPAIRVFGNELIKQIAVRSVDFDAVESGASRASRRRYIAVANFS